MKIMANNLPGRSLTVKAPNNSDKNVYVNSVYLNGRRIDKTYLDYKQIMRGGVLRFNMSPRPSTRRGTQQWQKPASLTQGRKAPQVKTDAFDKGQIDGSDQDYKKLVDNDSNTVTTVKNNSTLDVKLDRARRIDMLTLSNSTKDTKFKNVKIYGSRDGKHWRPVDQVRNVKFTYDKSTKPYLIRKTFAPYQHYRLKFEGGSGQLGEVELLGNMD